MCGGTPSYVSDMDDGVSYAKFFKDKFTNQLPVGTRFHIRPVARPKSRRVQTAKLFAMKSTRKGSNDGELPYPK